MIYHVDSQGNLELLKDYGTTFRTGWTQIVPIPQQESPSEDLESNSPMLLFYDDIGHGEIYRVSVGDIVLLNGSDDYTESWSNIVALPYFLRPRVFHIRIQAIVTGEENGPTFTPDFSLGTIEQAVANTNVVFKESGIRFEFDPAADVEEIQSSLLNRDFAWDANDQQTLFPVDKDNNAILPAWESTADQRRPAR